MSGFGYLGGIATVKKEHRSEQSTSPSIYASENPLIPSQLQATRGMSMYKEAHHIRKQQ